LPDVGKRQLDEVLAVIGAPARVPFQAHSQASTLATIRRLSKAAITQIHD
jgi:hypothetical protein